MVYGDTQMYRDNWDVAFGQEKVQLEVDLDDDLIEIITKLAEENNVSFDEQFEVMLREGLEIMEQEGHFESEIE